MGQTEKKPVTRDDLFQFRFVSEEIGRAHV